ncbi:MAG: NUDIX hydrolase [Candidatus Sungbacteria bacterium]|nr:NUDIX hydrolase [Candidatus Sungbacteria bacterium]
MAKTPRNLRFAVLAADTTLFVVRDGQLKVLLMKINRPPYFANNYWGVPGGLVDPKETADEAALRHLREKAGAKFSYMEQLYTFSALDRDPRGRVVSVAYLALTPVADLRQEGSEVRWFSVDNLPKLAYDHREIIRTALERLRSKLTYTNIAFGLLPEEFTLGELQRLYEIILDRRIDKRNFRKKLFQLKLVVGTKKKKRAGRSRPAELYRFVERKHKIAEIL